MAEKEALLLLKDEKELTTNDLSENQKEKPKRRDIQGLRGVAIIYVLIYHLYPKLFPHGFLGVDIFFVISGYLITMILWNQQPFSFKTIGTFFIKRVKRIFPAYYLLLLGVLIFGFYSTARVDYRLLQIDTLWATGFATNLHKYLRNLDYFAELQNYDFLLHTWSLAVEIQFYLIAPILILILASGKIGKVLISAVFAISVYFNIFATGPLEFSSIFCRIWQFLCGGFAYLYPAGAQNKIYIVGTIFIISPIMLLFPLRVDFLRFAVTMASAIIISLDDKLANDHLLGNKFLYYIGEISYSVYLFHWPIILCMKYELNSEVLSIRDAIIAVELSLLLGVVSFKFIEKVFLRLRFIYTAILISVIVCSIIFMTILMPRVHPSIKNTLQFQHELKSYNEITRFEKNCYGFHDVPYLPVNITTAKRRLAFEKNLFFKKAIYPTLTTDYKLKDSLVEKYFVKTKTSIQFLDYYKGNGSLTVAVIGNSFAHSAFNGVVTAFKEHIKEIRLLSISACQPFLEMEKVTKGYPYRCTRYFNMTVALIGEMKPDIIFLIFRPLYAVTKPFDNIENDQTMNLMQKTIDYYLSVSKVILLQMPLPAANKGYTSKILRILERNETFNGLYLPFPTYRHEIYHAAKRLEHLRCDRCVKIYAHQIFCDTKICRVFDPDNLFSFYDNGAHLNQHAQKCINKLYRETLEEVLIDGLV